MGSTTTRTSTFTVPASACPGDFTAASSSLVFKDFVGNERTVAVTTPLQILDVAAPTLTVSAAPALLWPPNHKFQDITVTLAVHDNCDAIPTIKLVSVSSSEPETGVLGNGDKGPDIQGATIGTDDRSFQLRSERDTGHGATGRLYTIKYSATDVSGNSSEATTTVLVPANASGS